MGNSMCASAPVGKESVLPVSSHVEGGRGIRHIQLGVELDLAGKLAVLGHAFGGLASALGRRAKHTVRDQLLIQQQPARAGGVALAA
jgi:hypothetical protein